MSWTIEIISHKPFELYYFLINSTVLAKVKEVVHREHTSVWC